MITVRSRLLSGALVLFAAAQLTAQGTAATSNAATSNAADVRFMQGMISHHAQAIEMAALVMNNTRRADLRLLAEKIDVSQKDEIAMMQRWLRERGQVAPEPGTHDHMAGGQHQMPMPGMLSPEQMTALNAARDAAFDRLFLVGMIQHHEGALTMVAQLFGSIGAAQESDVFRFASDVDTDQRGEIARMRAMLSSTP